MNLAELKASGYGIYSIIAGSHLYGLNTPQSDTDIRGIFNLPLREYLKTGSTRQINDDTNDEVHYEVSKFLHLATLANPNILELLFAPKDKVLSHSPAMDPILDVKEAFLTKQCRLTLGGYAIQQIHKARGQNKMIVNPCTERKTPLDFCYLHHDGERTSSLAEFLTVCGIDQNVIGLAKVNNFPTSYAMYSKRFAQHRCFDPASMEIINNWTPRGIINTDLSSNELRLTSIPEEVARFGYMGIFYYNQDGYAAHCKEYASYQTWVRERNPARYATNLEHGKGYDSKNMMHCFRLLNMGIELADTGVLNVVRPDREYLLKIRAGEFGFEELIEQAEEKLKSLDEKFAKSSLPDHVDPALVDSLIYDLKVK